MFGTYIDGELTSALGPATAAPLGEPSRRYRWLRVPRQMFLRLGSLLLGVLLWQLAAVISYVELS